MSPDTSVDPGKGQAGRAGTRAPLSLQALTNRSEVAGEDERP